MSEVYILLGGNIGDTNKIFQDALVAIQDEIGVIMRKSAIYRSPAWGFESSQDFLNQVICVQSDLDPELMVLSCMKIEKEQGREREAISSGYSSRTIDIDILLIGQLRINSVSLTVPHPRMHLRRFTLLPLAEIAPTALHPSLGMSVSQLLEACTDTSEVHRINQ